MGGESVGVDVCFQWFLASLHAAEQLCTLPVRSTLHTEGSECKVTKKYWNFQIVSRGNCTFGDKNCTFGTFWHFLGECRITRCFRRFSSPRLQSPFYRFSVTRYRLQFFYKAIIRREAWKIAKYVSKNIYYYIYNIYIIYIIVTFFFPFLPPSLQNCNIVTRNATGCVSLAWWPANHHPV